MKSIIIETYTAIRDLRVLCSTHPNVNKLELLN